MAGLSAEKIVDTAYELLVQYGLQDVSMRRISSVLQVRPGALYYHVPHKQELLRLLAHRVVSGLSLEGQDAEKLLLGLREALLDVPDGGDLALIAYSLDSQLPPAEALCAALETQGLDVGQAQQRSGLLMRYALGSIVVEQNASLFERSAGISSTQRASGKQLYLRGVQLLLRE